MLSAILDLPPHDLLLVGDGSGTTADRPCGWCCYAACDGNVVVHYGGTSHGTNNYAELALFLHALWHFDATAKRQAKTRVCLVSDSELTVRCGNRQYARNANGALWASADWFETHGYALRWFHVRRNSNPYHTSCDAIAGIVRRLLTEATIAGKIVPAPENPA